MENFSRHVKVGDSEGWCGARFIVAIVRPFTPGEDAVALWITMQDDTRMLDILPLQDGRDYIVFERLYKTQTVREAHAEVEVFWQRIFDRLPKQHDTPKGFE